MMVPIIALVGRKNVGKSTLFNLLTHTRDALVSNFQGFTRDRKYGFAEIKELKLIYVDTSGIDDIKEREKNCIIKQSLLAIEEADLVLFMVDARTGLTSIDLEIAEYLRSREKKTFILANKIDGIDVDQAIAEFWSLGFDKIYPISASHGKGIDNLIETAVFPFVSGISFFKEKNNRPISYWIQFKEKDSKKKRKKNDNFNQNSLPIKLAIVGHPNVGKSTIVNRLVCEDRMIVYDMPGTTRDSIDIPMIYNERKYILTDTAGIRRSKKIISTAEKLSIIKSLQVIKNSDIVLLVLDAENGVSDQDLSLLRLIIRRGRSLVIVVNKWDILNKKEKKNIKEKLNHHLVFVDFIRIHFISALYDRSITDIFESVCEAYDNSFRKVSTATLTYKMNMAIKNHQPPIVHGHRIKLKYAHIGGYNPPIIVIHGNQVKNLPHSYNRYLINFFHKSLKMIGTPIRIQLKEGDNPYAKKRNISLLNKFSRNKYLIKNNRNR